MYFQILNLILWPKVNALPRVVNFTPGMVNVISGASKTGKSAVIPIIDYCLGADKCAIPVGVIRDNCAWFGILIETIDGKKLLARREPGATQSTGEMFILEGGDIKIPDKIKEKNTNVMSVKSMLNRLAGLSALDFEPETENGFKTRPSFRDLMAFNFQPQNIVANPNVLFFKADTTEHREKLKTIFPYVLGAVTPAILQARAEIDALQRILRRKETELKTRSAANNAWQLEIQSWIRQAIEFGLLPSDYVIPSDWLTQVDALKKVSLKNSRNATPDFAGIDIALKRLKELRTKESGFALELSEHRKRLNEMRRLLESSDAFGDAIKIQRDRLSLSQWLRDLVESRPDELQAVIGSGDSQLQRLCDTLEALEIRISAQPSVSDTLDKEINRQRREAEIVLENLMSVRREIAQLEQESDVAKEAAQRSDRIERFLGRIEQALVLYEVTDQTSDLRAEIDKLQTDIAKLQKTVSESRIRERVNSALDRISNFSGQIVPLLDGEWPDAPIRLVIQDLTIEVLNAGGRNDQLWEIGSGANWLAYHVASMLALQRFFLAEPNHPVPGLLVFDQPSQVYFPRRSVDDEVAVPIAWKDKDVEAVRKVFSVMGAEVEKAAGRLQIIVLDHADQEVWGKLPEVTLTAEWRDKDKLVPMSWLAHRRAPNDKPDSE